MKLNKRAFENVFGRLKVVLKLIVDDNGDNNLVGNNRGKLFRDATIVDVAHLPTNDENLMSDDLQDDEESTSSY